MVNYTMKKLLVALLIACMVFTVLVAAEETTFVNGNSVYSRFDFGTKSNAVTNNKTSDADLRAILTEGTMKYKTDFAKVSITSTDDTWIVKALVNGASTTTLGAAGLVASTSPLASFEYTTWVGGMALDFADINDSDDFTDVLFPGWGTYTKMPYSYENYNNAATWHGRHQYAKVRLINRSANTKMGMTYNFSGSYSTTMFQFFTVSANNTDFVTYIFDMVWSSDYGSARYDRTATQLVPGGNWVNQGKKLAGICFFVLGNVSRHDYQVTSTAFEEFFSQSCGFWSDITEAQRQSILGDLYLGDGTANSCYNAFVAEADAEWLTAALKVFADKDLCIRFVGTKANQNIDTAKAVVAGDEVEIDYIIFATTFEAASCYTSTLDVATETTGWLVWYNKLNAEIESSVVASYKAEKGIKD